MSLVSLPPYLYTIESPPEASSVVLSLEKATALLGHVTRVTRRVTEKGEVSSSLPGVTVWHRHR